MRAVDDVIIARLETTPVDIKDGYFNAVPDSGVVIVEYDLPYAVYYSSVGDDDEETRRLCARIPRESVFFSLTYVGVDRNQTKAAGESLRSVLRRWRPAVAGFRCEVVTLLESQRIRRDDHAIRKDGSPLFYGVDNYAVGVRPSA